MDVSKIREYLKRMEVRFLNEQRKMKEGAFDVEEFKQALLDTSEECEDAIMILRKLEEEVKKNPQNRKGAVVK